MKIVQVCLGSACHLNGSEAIVERMQETVKQHALEDEIVLVGSFCTGNCNRRGVTIQVDDEVFPGITREGFKEFFEAKVLAAIGRN